MNEGQKHTPGPWTLEANGGDDPDPRRKLVCAPNTWGSTSMLAEIDTRGDLPGSWEANARLIAAAPTMYEGIGDFLAAYDRARIGDWDHWKLIDWLGEQVARLRTVYAKAEGRADG